MSISDVANKNIPEYYDTMYLDGYTPQEVYIAFKKKMADEYSKKDSETEIHIVSEEK